MLVEKLRQRRLRADELLAFSCPSFHDTPDAPLWHLSVHLKALSDIADEIASFELKLAALYLRMTLYGPVQRFFLDTFAPSVLISDRHPLIETLVYLPLYQRKIASSTDSFPAARLIRRLLEERVPGAYDAIIAWQAVQSRRLGRNVELCDVAADLLESFTAPAPARMAMLQERYRTTLPDVVVMLDVDVSEAMRRSDGRDARAELHEEQQALTMLREGYEVVLAELPGLHPGIEVHRIANTGRTIEPTLDDLLLALRWPAAPARAPA